MFPLLFRDGAFNANWFGKHRKSKLNMYVQNARNSQELKKPLLLNSTSY